MRDPYDVLGVDRSATQEEIKGAFRRLAGRHHPDKNPDDSTAGQRFKEINAAYQILSDPQRRTAFDRFGAAGLGGASPGAASSPFGGMPFDVGDLNIDGLFGDLLGALGIKVGERGHLRKEVKVTFEEAAFGCTKQVSYERAEVCHDCRGGGSAAGSKPETCPACHGRGKVRFQQGVLPIAIERPCSRCGGRGRLVVDPCMRCRGAGVTAQKRTVEVTIPAGVDNGASRVVERGGNYIRPDRPAGDLELIIRVAPHELFRRSGDDLLCSLPISFARAALGGEIEIPTLEGRGRLRVPSGTQPGTVLRIKGKGIPRRMMAGRGDLLVEVNIEVPTQLTDAQKDLIAKLGEELGENVQPQQATFMDKLKSLFG